jgi:hypothetical protein
MPDASNPHYEEAWQLGLLLFEGTDVNLKERLGTQTDWMVIGPFANDETFSGYSTVYPPEDELNLGGEYEGVDGEKVKWSRYREEGSLTSVNLKKVYEPSEYVCAYAYCTIRSPEEKRVQLRIGTNDWGKMWVGGELVYDYPHDGSAILDRDIVPCTLKKGTNPILIKACNGQLDWGFVFRITDEKGNPIEGLKVELE